jgi:hypothetical protein
MPARGLLGIASDFVAEAEPITVRNRNPGGNSAVVADGYTVTHADRNAHTAPVRAASPHRALCTE